MSQDDQNPFERFGLDPREGIAGITERMRGHIQAAATEPERAEIRDAWVALTKDPRKRLALSLGAHPETREPLGAPPTAEGVRVPELTRDDVLPHVPSIACFGGHKAPPDTALPWLDDPLLTGVTPPGAKKRAAPRSIPTRSENKE